MVDAHRVDRALHRILDEQIPRMGHPDMIEPAGLVEEVTRLVVGYLRPVPAIARTIPVS